MIAAHSAYSPYPPNGGNTDLPASQALVYGKYLLEHAQTCCPSTLACLTPPLPQVEFTFGPGHWPESLQPGSSVRRTKMLTSGTLSLAACAKRKAMEDSSQFQIPPSVAPSSAIPAFWRSTTLLTTWSYPEPIHDCEQSRTACQGLFKTQQQTTQAELAKGSTERYCTVRTLRFWASLWLWLRPLPPLGQYQYVSPSSSRSTLCCRSGRSSMKASKSSLLQQIQRKVRDGSEVGSGGRQQAGILSILPGLGLN